jgi:glucose/arabinose dehydrogenase
MPYRLPFRRSIGAFILSLGSAAMMAEAQTTSGTSAIPQFPYPTVRDFRGVVPPQPPPWAGVPLADGPFFFETYEQRHIRVDVVTRGLRQPWSIAFLPDGAILITEREGRLRIVRDDVLDPTPVAGTPAVVSRATMAGLMDLALHPKFADNQWIYISYHKPVYGDLGSNAIVRGTWNGQSLTDVRDIFVSSDVDMEASRIAFGPDGMLYMTVGGPGTGPEISVMRAQNGNDHAGKLLRLEDDGSVPPDNPFVGRAGYKPEIYSMGHRNQLGLAVNPYTGDLWASEQGPNGGDEINIIKPGKNYGWPVVSDGRNYLGPYISKSPYREGMERPHVVWVPSPALSGMTFYTGDAFPNWKRNVFVGGMREGEVPRTGQLIRLVFNENWEELRRESLLRDLHQRIRDVRQGPDGLLYLITAEDEAALLRISPAEG